jgi:hypothetical protein
VHATVPSVSWLFMAVAGDELKGRGELLHMMLADGMVADIPAPAARAFPNAHTQRSRPTPPLPLTRIG